MNTAHINMNTAHINMNTAHINKWDFLIVGTRFIKSQCAGC